MSIYNSFTIVGYVNQIGDVYNDLTRDYSGEGYTGLSLETSCDNRAAVEESVYGPVHSIQFNIKKSDVEGLKTGDLIMIKGHMVGVTSYSGDTGIAFNNILAADYVHLMQSDLDKSKSYAAKHFQKAKNVKGFREFDEEEFNNRFK